MSLRVTSDLNEIAYGEWEGHTKQEVEEKYTDEYRSWLADPTLHAPTGGELAGEIIERALHLIAEIKQEFSAGDILLVSHKATIRIILCQLLGINLADFRYRLGCPVSSVSVVEFAAHGPMLHSLADRSHLSARLRDLPGT